MQTQPQQRISNLMMDQTTTLIDGVPTIELPNDIAFM